ncbi:helix-turn-helix transcriptional regulator [Vibrio cholerae]
MNNQTIQTNQFDRVISMKEVAQILNRSPKTIWKWYAKDEIIPRPLMVAGRAVGYRASVLNQIIDGFQR